MHLCSLSPCRKLPANLLFASPLSLPELSLPPRTVRMLTESTRLHIGRESAVAAGDLQKGLGFSKPMGSSGSDSITLPVKLAEHSVQFIGCYRLVHKAYEDQSAHLRNGL
jgi:hypothetical protein